MIIRLGLHLDGQRGRKPANRLGEITVGPLGMLGILELQLGLATEGCSEARRIVEYRDCLERCDSEKRFFHRTFESDQLGTAATLLAWRDLWILHGWRGTFPDAASAKLRDMAAVEILAREEVHPSAGERLATVAERLGQRAVAIEEILLFDPVAEFPKRWREVLALLPTKDANPESSWKPAKGFLGKLQGELRLAQDRKKGEGIRWVADGTLAVARAETRALAGAWFASRLASAAFSDMIVAPSGGDRLDSILGADARARQGLQESSPFRPTLQVLPLALEILWEPLNFYGVLQFLTHPVCPVPAYARRVLAAKLADRPGIGGAAWTEALHKIEEKFGGADNEEAKAVREKIRHWIEHDRHPQDAGAPISIVRERVGRLRDYFRSRLGDTDPAARTAFNAGFSQCNDCHEALGLLQEQGAKTIRPRQLQRLVVQATATGSGNPLREAQVGAQLSITHPAAAIEPCGRVLWWQLGLPPLPAPYPWSRAELESLAAAGAELPSVEALLERTAREWLRPVLAAREELVLVLPPAAEEVHPLWQMIQAVTKGIPVVSLDALIAAPSSGAVEVVHAPLPARRRWWQLPDDLAVHWPGPDSFSSLELFVFNPYQWLLRYPARLKPSRILSVSNDFLLFGNLAHALVERFYTQTGALKMSKPKFGAWYREAFDRLIGEEGAVLLMPGRRADLEGFRIQLERALVELREQIAGTGAKEVSAELKLDGAYPGGKLIGFADLIIRNKAGQKALLDMKWSGDKKYPEKLHQNRHLQLALYAELLRQKDGSWPGVAYFILKGARLYAPDEHIFPGARVVTSASGEGTAELWQRFLKTWRWRKEQVARGTFEIALESLDEDAAATPPEDAMALEYLNPEYNEYLTLAGWDA